MIGSRPRPRRLAEISGIGVDRVGSLADAAATDMLRLENLDTNIPPDPAAIARTCRAAADDDDNSYLPFVGQLRLRSAVAQHVSRLSGVQYDGNAICIISAGGLSGILNVLLATVEVGDEVIVTDPTYAGLINRIRLVGAVPRFAPFLFTPGAPWRLDRGALAATVSSNTRALLLMSPSMPSGGTLDREDWQLVANLCVDYDLLLIVNAAMERLLFDGREPIAPTQLPEMAERTNIVGSAAKELRMIGWRVGWIVAPHTYMPGLVAVSLANVVVPVGIAQNAVALALERSGKTLPAYLAALQRRRDVVLDELKGLPVGVPAGGWSLLLQTTAFGIDAATLSKRLLQHGVAATPMDGWGEAHARQYLRLVFANETVERMRGLGNKVRAALRG